MKTKLRDDFRRNRRVVEQILKEKNNNALLNVPPHSLTRRVGIWILTAFLFCIGRGGAWLVLLVPLALFSACALVIFPAVGSIRYLVRFSTEQK